MNSNKITSTSNSSSFFTQLTTNTAGTASNKAVINTSDVIGVDGNTLGTIRVITDKYEEERFKNVEKLLDWMKTNTKAEMGKYHTGCWSKIISGFEIKAEFGESAVVNTKYVLSLYVKSATEPGKDLIRKAIYFSTDESVYEWFKSHDIDKLIDASENNIRDYYKAYCNLNTVFDLELSL